MVDGDGVRVRLTGSVAVERDGSVATSSSRARQTLLALLALTPGEAVAVEVLIEEMWSSSRVPDNPRASLHTAVTRVRRWLGADDAEGPAGRRLLRSNGSGYVLELAPTQVDLVCFHHWADRVLAPAAAGVPELAAEALRYWRGTPFPGLDAPRLVVERERAQERWLRVQERAAAASTTEGHPERAVEVLLPLIAAHPGREQLYVLALEALHHAGRPARATELYLSVRRHLRDQHGVEPGLALREAHRRIAADRAARARVRRRRPMTVGRDETITTILGSLSGAGRLVVLEGEAGIGKSVVLAAAHYDADRAGATVLSGAWDDDSSPMSAWHEALDDRPDDGAAAGLWVHGRLAELALGAPVLVSLDDVQRADSASLGVLRTLLRVGIPPGIVLVLAARRPDDTAHPEWDGLSGELQRASQTRWITLGALGRDAVEQLTRRRLAAWGPAAADRFADLLWRRTRGQPLHTGALLALLGAQPDEAAALKVADEIPEALRGTLRHQLARMPAPTRLVLEALAVLRPLGVRALGAALGRPALDIADQLRPAVAAGVVLDGDDVVDFRHEMLADTALDAVSALTRQRIHHDRLATLGDDDDDVFTRLRHTLGAAPLLAPRVVAEARLQAGKAAYERRALLEALALLEDAGTGLAPSDSDTASVDLAVHQGLVLAALGRLAESDDVLDAAVTSCLRGGHRALAARAAVGDDPVGVVLTGHTRRRDRLQRIAAQILLPPPERFEVLVALHRENALRGETTTTSVLDELDALAEALGNGARIVARVCAVRARAVTERPLPAAQRLEHVEQAHRLAVATNDPMLVQDTTAMMMETSLAAARPDAARGYRDELQALARRWHRPRQLWAVALFDSVLMLASGSTTDADRAARAALDLGQELGLPDAAGAFTVHTFTRHWLGGTLPELGDAAARAASEHPTAPTWSAAAAAVAAQAGRIDEAAEHLREYHRRRRRRPTGTPFDRAGLCLAVTAAFPLAHEETAEHVRDALTPVGDSIVGVGFGSAAIGPAMLFTGLAALVLHRVDLARDELVRARDLCRQLGWKPWAEAADTLNTWGVEHRPIARLPLGLEAPARRDLDELPDPWTPPRIR